MAPRNWFGCLAALALASSLAACKGDGKGSVDKGASMTARCEQLAKACGDKDKHIEKIVEVCKQIPASCATQATAAFDCYEKQLCGKADRIWALEDLGKLAERHGACKAERDALAACTTPKGATK
jgi:hypothetical protein